MLNGPRTRSARERIGPAELRRRAERLLDNTARAGATTYERRRDLPRLIRIDPAVPEAESIGFIEAVVGRLARALRAERLRGRAGHWTYDLNRHIALRQAYLAESGRLAALKAQRL